MISLTILPHTRDKGLFPFMDSHYFSHFNIRILVIIILISTTGAFVKPGWILKLLKLLLKHRAVFFESMKRNVLPRFIEALNDRLDPVVWLWSGNTRETRKAPKEASVYSAPFGSLGGPKESTKSELHQGFFCIAEACVTLFNSASRFPSGCTAKNTQLLASPWSALWETLWDYALESHAK